MIVRPLIVILVAALLGLQVVRNSTVAALSETRPATAARFWSAHPAVELSLGLLEIGRASRQLANERDLVEREVRMGEPPARQQFAEARFQLRVRPGRGAPGQLRPERCSEPHAPDGSTMQATRAPGDCAAR